MVEGIQDVVMKKDYELVVCATADTHRLLVERYVDGAIILNYRMEDELLTSLANDKLPCVVLDRELKNPYIKNVLLPNEEGSAIAVRYLQKKGHKRIGFIAGSEASYDGETRLKGFRKEIENLDLHFLEKDLIRADFTEMSGYTEMKNYLIKANGDYPTAIICANDEMAIGAVKAIQESKIKVPDDISVVGFDDIYMSSFFTPSLTTISVPRKKWGITAANTLFKMLEQDFEFKPEPLKIELMSRNSG